MIKIYHENKLLFQSFILREVYEFIIKTKIKEIKIINNFNLLTYDDFCNLYLSKTKDFNTYCKLEFKLNKTPSIYALLQEFHASI